MRFHPQLEFLESRCLLSAGSLDTRFGKAGTATASFGGDVIRSRIAVQSDGKIVVAMAVKPNSSSAAEQFVLTRFTTDGTLDKTFGKSGEFEMAMSGGMSATRLQGRGSIRKIGSSSGRVSI